MATSDPETTVYNKSIGIFGGTFDPVHDGHVTIAQDIQQHLHLDEMRLMPCHLPPHRQNPHASDQDRLHMLKLATKNTLIIIDDLELRRDGPSYTVDTLLQLRDVHGPNCSLVLCMGMDAFAHFDTWHHWQKILTLAHIVVVARATNTQQAGIENLSTNLDRVLAQHKTTNKLDLKKSAAGKIYLTQLSQIPVSSTAIRLALSRGDQSIPGLNADVQKFIKQRGLYNP